jgi:predicted DNA-binding antitoxin AbrB/MazE fold protein
MDRRRSRELTITINVTFENGMLKPKQPLTLTEGAEVRVAISTVEDDEDPLAGSHRQRRQITS